MNISLTRRSVLSGVATATIAAGIGVGTARAQAAQFVLKVGTDQPDTAPLGVILRQAADKIAKDTNGRVELKIFPNNQLGGAPAMLSQLRSGALECFFVSGISVLSTVIPKASIYGLAFAFENDRIVYEALDGELGQALRQQIRSAGFAVTDNIWANGFRQTTSSGAPIKTIKDLQGFKIRVPPSQMWVSTFKSLGASPTALPFSDVYTALQTRVVDGQETPLTLISTAKFYEVQKYCALTNHMWDGFWCLFSGRVWKSIPEDLQKIISENLDAAALRQRVSVAEENARLQDDLTKHGLVFNNIDREEFRDRLRKEGYYNSWRQTFGDELWKSLEKYSGPLA